jgi:hypothetical protein
VLARGKERLEITIELASETRRRLEPPEVGGGKSDDLRHLRVGVSDLDACVLIVEFAHW